MHISIEGMDGVGKTTLIHKIGKVFDYKIIEKSFHDITKGKCFKRRRIGNTVEM